MAAPSDDQLQSYWWIWSSVAILGGLTGLTVFFAILASKKARSNPFNLYLLYSILPDFTFSLLCSVTCLLNAIKGSYWSHWMCNFQQWYVVFGIGGNAWMNAIITYQLHTMLRYSHQCRRYKSPSRLAVSMQALAVYLYVGSLGVLGMIDDGASDDTNWPFHSGAPSGLACLPIERDRRSSISFWLVYFPLFTGIPMAYFLYACFDIWRYQLLPKTGRRRLLAVYFGRLIMVFWIMWLPTMVLLYFAATFVDPWVHVVGGVWSHLQGAASACVSLLKPDIMKAFQNFIRCNCQKQWEDDYYDREDGATRSAMFSSNNDDLRRSATWSTFFNMPMLSFPDRKSRQGINSTKIDESQVECAITEDSTLQRPEQGQQHSSSLDDNDDPIANTDLENPPNIVGSDDNIRGQEEKDGMDHVKNASDSVGISDTNTIPTNGGLAAAAKDVSDCVVPLDEQTSAASAENILHCPAGEDDDKEQRQKQAQKSDNNNRTTASNKSPRMKRHLSIDCAGQIKERDQIYNRNSAAAAKHCVIYKM